MLGTLGLTRQLAEDWGGLVNSRRLFLNAKASLVGGGLIAAFIVANPSVGAAAQDAPTVRAAQSSTSQIEPRNALKRACQTTAIQYRVKCAGKGRLRDICRSNWGTGARFGDIGYDRRGLLVCVQVPSGFIGVWQRF